MSMKLNPYLSFRDSTRAAMEFYQSIFGGELEMHTFKEFQASKDPAEDTKIMHSELKADNGISFMAADTPNRMEFTPGSTISISIAGKDLEPLQEYFNKLSADGTEIMPMEKADWGDTFGMCTDKFGTKWMISCQPNK